MTDKISLSITRSQQMALIDILLIHIRRQDEPQEFLDVARDVTTTTGELLRLFSDQRILVEPRNLTPIPSADDD